MSRQVKKSGRITYGNAHIRALLVPLAWAASRTKGTYLKSEYHSLVGRRGTKKAIIAVGHKILIAAYFIIKDKVNFTELGENLGHHQSAHSISSICRLSL